jgi:hypothetical protein
LPQGEEVEDFLQARIWAVPRPIGEIPSTTALSHPVRPAGGLSFAEQTALLLTLATPFHCPRVPGRIGGVTTMFSYSQSRATAMNHGACTACTTGTELTCDIFLGTQPRGTEYLQSALACRLTALPLSPISIYQSLYKIHPGSSHADGSLPKEPLSTRDKLRS